MTRLLRSLAFNLAFYLNLTLQLIVFAPVFFFVSEERAWRIVKNWARSSLWLLRHLAGVSSEVVGRQNIPAGPVIVASKHQSYWDVFALLPELEKPTFILKKELMRVPIFGAFASRMKMIPIDRARRGGVIASMIEGAHAAVAEGRQIVIFPEGTRTLPGDEVEYRQGVYRLYEALGLPVVPVALNSGVFWPRRSFLRHPGTIRAAILDPIAPGLARQAFLGRLRGGIETSSTDLLREAVEYDPTLPIDDAVRDRLSGGRDAPAA
ncbi:1-acyl-sn-glycerol-3-phosphate acyltransferase [Aurantimonas sp. VKM B-3413]|uniref:lysophospholipid acyltransferase family protein n=1 Tax=Aurantimonas sp. VKM B-3413 TaxID=2779401 RepID=UPI001E3CD63E|nr:lysophospholipid acyltransferase family protein [Aurantimonas sp. VKM B-3413]MCB8837238.1 1-acyl-sn-glycerol-3-phosphate acyltransferase [Aurantimonas sp. VKM B-3413]